MEIIILLPGDIIQDEVKKLIQRRVVLDKLKEELVKANIRLNEEVKRIVAEYEGPFSDIIKENYIISEKECLPLCQDTGILEFFVFLGHEVVLEEPIEKTLNSAVEEVYVAYPFRYSIVSDPVFERINTHNNTPVVVHVFQVEGKKLEIRFLVKGGGSENLSTLHMMNPSVGASEIKDFVVEFVKEHGAKACPPLHIGVGIGGTADKALVLSKLALTKDFSERHPDPRYAELEEEILRTVNLLGIGYQGLGHGITAYSVHVEYFPTHIATLPVAVSVDCYLCRKGKIVFED